MSYAHALASNWPTIPAPAAISVTPREPNHELLALLTKPEPLSAEEWRWVEALSAGEETTNA